MLVIKLRDFRVLGDCSMLWFFGSDKVVCNRLWLLMKFRIFVGVWCFELVFILKF